MKGLQVAAVFAIISISDVVAQSRFRDSPANATVLANFPTTLSCTIQQPIPSSMVWQRGFSRVGVNDGRFSISLDSLTGRSELRVSSVQYGDAGEYSCVAQDANGNFLATSQSGTITVQGIPVFATPLSPITVPLGGIATLICQVISNPPATITWFYEQGSVTRRLTTEGRLSISLSNVLTIINVLAADAGYYVCSAQNAFGTNMTSGRLQIGVPLPPFQVAITPSDQDPLQVMEGGSVTLRCSVLPGTPLSSITWLRSSVGLTEVTQVPDGLLLALSPTVAGDTGMYTCTAMDVNGNSVSQSIGITVLIPPSFTTLPQNVSGVVDTSLKETVTCLAEGAPAPTITWLRPDLTPLPGGPRFDSLTREDGGIYTCLAANSVGENRTQFTITVEGPPVLRVDPTEVTTHPGSDVVFNCIVEGFPSPSVSWSRLGASLTAGNSLHLFGVSSSDAGSYTCSAVNNRGSRTGQVILNVLANPSISSVSVSPVAIRAPSPLTLRCMSTGPPGTTLEWYLNDTRLDPGSDSNVLIQQDGTLVVMTTNIRFTGTYSCNVSTSFASVVSEVHVLVGVNPEISTPPSNLDLAPGQTTTLECQVSGFPHPHTTWRKINPVSRVVEVLDVIGPSHIQLSTGLQLHNVSSNDSGMYQCEVQNAFGSAMEQATVRVEGPPLATSIGPNTTLANGSTASLVCSTPLNYPMATISWTSRGGVLPAGRFSVDETGVLTVSPVLVEDSGDIMCTATNQYGQSSVTANITVLFPPSVIVTPPTVDVIVDSSVVLSCVAQGEPTPNVVWRLPDSSNVDSKSGRVTSAGGLPINNAVADDAGLYTCEATNQLGVANGTSMVTIRGAAIPGVLVEVTGTTSLRVEWQAPSFDILSRLIDYEVIIAREGRGQVIQEQVPTFFGRNNYPASDLLPGVVYVVTVRGLYTEDVIGVNSTLEATTQETAPTGPPLNLTVTPLENALYMEWELPAEDERNGVINGYTIEYRLISGGRAGDPVMVNLSVPSGGNAGVIYALMDLNGGGTYEVQVGAFTAAGVGPLTDSVTVVTFQGSFNPQGAVSIAIGVGVALIVVALLVATLLGVYVVCLVYRRKTRAGKHEPLVAAEKGRRRDEKERKRKTVSGPIAAITPQIDSVDGKFTIHGEDGNVLDLKPKVITSKDVATPPRKGATVQVVGRSETILAPSNDDSDAGRIDAYTRYTTPADALKERGGVPPRRQQSSSPVETRQRVSSGVYAEVSNVMKIPPKSRKSDGDVGEESEDPEDRPYEAVEYDRSGDMWGRDAEEESAGDSRSSFRYQEHPPSPDRPEAPDTGRDDSNLVYASVSQDHIEKKRRLKEEQMQQKEETQEETKKERKMREKMEREKSKMEEKERKKQEKERKEQEKEKKRLEAERQKRKKERESMGLSNVSGYQDIDFTKPGAWAQAEFIDSATASLF